jgi:hypothetical protein
MWAGEEKSTDVLQSLLADRWLCQPSTHCSKFLSEALTFSNTPTESVRISLRCVAWSHYGIIKCRTSGLSAGISQALESLSPRLWYTQRRWYIDAKDRLKQLRLPSTSKVAKGLRGHCHLKDKASEAFMLYESLVRWQSNFEIYPLSSQNWLVKALLPMQAFRSRCYWLVRLQLPHSERPILCPPRKCLIAMYLCAAVPKNRREFSTQYACLVNTLKRYEGVSAWLLPSSCAS